MYVNLEDLICNQIQVEVVEVTRCFLWKKFFDAAFVPPAGTKYCYKGHNDGTECRNPDLTDQTNSKSHNDISVGCLQSFI